MTRWRGRSVESLVVVVVVEPPPSVGGMRSSHIRAAKEGGHSAGRGQALGSSLGQAVNQPVGTPVESGEQLAVTLGGDTNRRVRFVSRHPNQLASVDDRSEVVTDNVSDA